MKVLLIESDSVYIDIITDELLKKDSECEIKEHSCFEGAVEKIISGKYDVLVISPLLKEGKNQEIKVCYRGFQVVEKLFEKNGLMVKKCW